MLTGRCTREPGPDLLKPRLMVPVGEQAENLRRDVRRTVAAWLPLHQDEFDIVLDDRVRLIGLAEERRAVTLRFEPGVGDLVPDDRGQVIIPHRPAMLLYGCVQGDD